jgi:hypothetical protein
MEEASLPLQRLKEEGLYFYFICLLEKERVEAKVGFYDTSGHFGNGYFMGNARVDIGLTE